MLKVTINAIKGKKLEKPFPVFVKTKTRIDTENDRMIVAFTQSESKEGISDETLNTNFDYIGLSRGSVIETSPELPKKTSELSAKGDAFVEKFITDLKLTHVVSIEKV